MKKNNNYLLDISLCLSLMIVAVFLVVFGIEKEEIGNPYMTITALGDTAIDANNQTITLVNYEDNDVILKYFLYDENEKTIFVTDDMKPNSSVDVNLYDLLDKGVYKIKFFCYSGSEEKNIFSNKTNVTSVFNQKNIKMGEAATYTATISIEK